MHEAVGAQSPGGDVSGIQVYNDALPASSQPQTPRNLPEARHRSRFLGAFTAPPPARGRSPASTTRSHRWRRLPSPEGLSTPGFQGLYGGLENADDATLFEQALSRLGEVRRRDTSSDGPSL